MLEIRTVKSEKELKKLFNILFEFKLLIYIYCILYIILFYVCFTGFF